MFKLLCNCVFVAVMFFCIPRFLTKSYGNTLSVKRRANQFLRRCKKNTPQTSLHGDPSGRSMQVEALFGLVSGFLLHFAQLSGWPKLRSAHLVHYTCRVRTALRRFVQRPERARVPRNRVQLDRHRGPPADPAGGVRPAMVTTPDMRLAEHC